MIVGRHVRQRCFKPEDPLEVFFGVIEAGPVDGLLLIDTQQPARQRKALRRPGAAEAFQEIPEASILSVGRCGP